jgi:hypothetical protein
MIVANWYVAAWTVYPGAYPMALRTFMMLVLCVAALPGCGARSRRIAERGPKREIRVVNNCNASMRVYVDDDIKMRGQLMDLSTILPSGSSTIKKLYDGDHRMVMVPEQRGAGEPRQITFRVTGEARIRVCQ